MIEGVETSELGQLDQGAERDTRPPKPCSHRLDIEIAEATGMVRGIVWCIADDGHAGPHSYPFPRVINDPVTRRR